MVVAGGTGEVFTGDGTSEDVPSSGLKLPSSGA